MDYIAFIIIMLLFAFLGIVIGLKIGQEVGKRCQRSSKSYWLANAALLVTGLALSVLVSALGLPPFVGLVIGLMGGGIAGLKYGYGRSEGVWRTHDVWMRSDAALVKEDDAPDVDAEDESDTYKISVASPSAAPMLAKKVFVESRSPKRLGRLGRRK